MKKIIILITVLFFFKTSFSQYPNGIQTIGNDSNVVQAKGGFKGRVINWTYTDTTAANLERIRQYVGAQMVTTTPTLKFWIRNATATGWIDITSGGGASQTWQQTLLVSGGSLLTQNNDIDVAGYDFRFSSADEFGVGADSVSISINQALGRFKVTGIPSSDTTLSLVGITANGYLVKTNKSSLRPYTFTNGLTESGGTVKLGGTLTEAATTIDGNQNDLLFTDINEYIVESSVVELNGVSSGSSSSIRLDGVGIYLRPKNYQIFIDSLQATDTTQYIVGYRSNGQLVKTLKSSVGGYWTGVGNDIYNNNSGNVGVGISSPAFKLDVGGTAVTTDRKIGINSIQFGYYPDPTSFTGSMFFGTGGNNLSFTTGIEGGFNTGVGYFALDSNTRGYANTAVGANAMKNNTTGFYNVAVGTNALLSNKTGDELTAVGLNALYSNTTGQYNTGIGNNALLNNTTGQTNTAVGDHAMRLNTTGLQNSSIGYRSMDNNTTGYFNTAMAYRALEDNTSGYGNSAFGLHALSNNTTGYLNSGFGMYSMDGITTGRGNTGLGYFAGNNASQKVDAINSVALGSYSYTTADNQLRLSDSLTRITIPALPSNVGTKAVRYNPSTGDLSYADTTTGGGVTTLATFGAGARLPGDTAAFTDSTIYGSFYNDGEDTLVITAMRIVMQGTNDTLTINVEWNDSLNTTGTKLKTAYAAANNNYTGNSYTSFDNTKIPPGNHVWCKSPTVIPGRRPNYLSVTLIGYKKRV